MVFAPNSHAEALRPAPAGGWEGGAEPSCCLRGAGARAAAACVLKPCSSTCPGTGTAQARPLLGDSSRAYTQPTHGAHAPSSAPSWRLPDSTRPSSQDPLLPPAAHTGRAGARSHAHLQPCTPPGPADSRTDAPSPSCSAPAARRRTRVPLEWGCLGRHSRGQHGGGSEEHARLLCFAARRQAAGKRPRSGPGAAAASSRRAGGAPWAQGPWASSLFRRHRPCPVPSWGPPRGLQPRSLLPPACPCAPRLPSQLGPHHLDIPSLCLGTGCTLPCSITFGPVAGALQTLQNGAVPPFPHLILL